MIETIQKTIEDILKIIGFERFKIDCKEEEAVLHTAYVVAEEQPALPAGGLQTENGSVFRLGEASGLKKIIRINLQIDEDASLLIGYKGGNLAALQAILRLIFQKHFDPCPIIFLDINNYRQQREEYIKQLAKKTARQVALTKKAVELEPMNAAERRVVHSELAAHPELTTQSRGVGEERRVVVMPL